MALFAAIELDGAARARALDVMGRLAAVVGPERSSGNAAVVVPERSSGRGDVVVPERSSGNAKCRFEQPEKLHLTLAYVGRITPERHAAFAEALRAAAATCPQFSIVLDRLGGFPDERRPRLLWLGSSAPNEAYARCAHAVRTAFSDLGVVFDDDPIPHLTLCRCKHRLPRMPDVVPARAISLNVTELVLYDSVPAGPTTRYDVLLRAELA